MEDLLKNIPEWRKRKEIARLDKLGISVKEEKPKPKRTPRKKEKKK